MLNTIYNFTIKIKFLKLILMNEIFPTNNPIKSLIHRRLISPSLHFILIFYLLELHESMVVVTKGIIHL